MSGPETLVTGGTWAAAIAWENYRARFNHAFGLDSQGFSEGAFLPMPDTTASDPREAR